MEYSFNAEKVKDQCVRWIRNWFKANGNGCNAVIGISGGKDSTVVAALCKEALGADRVIGVMMPNGVQPDIEDSRAVIEHLGIKFVEVDINDAIVKLYSAIYRNIAMFYAGEGNMLVNISEQAKINLPPRIRMATLYAISQSCNGRVANTCNLSEDWVGYSTRWGDSVGDFAPLANLTSEEVVAIGDVLGLPHHLVHKVPSDGLCGKTDEDNLGFSYADLNRYIRKDECDDDTVREKIDAMHDKNMFKVFPIPKFFYCGIYDDDGDAPTDCYYHEAELERPMTLIYY